MIDPPKTDREVATALLRKWRVDVDAPDDLVPMLAGVARLYHTLALARLRILRGVVSPENDRARIDAWFIAGELQQALHRLVDCGVVEEHAAEAGGPFDGRYSVIAEAAWVAAGKIDTRRPCDEAFERAGFGTIA